jgi:hypothetical protein
MSSLTQTQMLSDDTAIRVAEGLTAADLGTEAVLLDARSGSYFGLNEVGLRIFQIAQNEPTVGEVIDTLLDEFDVSEEALRLDVDTFLQSMIERNLIEVRR